jgi:hypothetical protein
VQRPPVEALHEADRRVGEQRGDETRHEVGPERAHVGVEPHDHVACADVQRHPQRVALARAPRELGQHVVDGVDPGTLPRRGLGGRVGGAVVHHHDLVDQRDVLDQVAPHIGDDGTDGRLLVAGRQAHRDGGAAAHLGGDELVEAGVTPGVHGHGRPG